MTNIRKGDRLTHINGTVGTAALPVSRNTYGRAIVSVETPFLLGGKVARLQAPWNVEWIVKVERSGAEVAQQISMFEEER